MFPCSVAPTGMWDEESAMKESPLVFGMWMKWKACRSGDSPPSMGMTFPRKTMWSYPERRRRPEIWDLLSFSLVNIRCSSLARWRTLWVVAAVVFAVDDGMLGDWLLPFVLKKFLFELLWQLKRDNVLCRWMTKLCCLPPILDEMRRNWDSEA